MNSAMLPLAALEACTLIRCSICAISAAPCSSTAVAAPLSAADHMHGSRPWLAVVVALSLSVLPPRPRALTCTRALTRFSTTRSSPPGVSSRPCSSSGSSTGRRLLAGGAGRCVLSPRPEISTRPHGRVFSPLCGAAWPGLHLTSKTWPYDPSPSDFFTTIDSGVMLRPFAVRRARGASDRRLLLPPSLLHRAVDPCSWRWAGLRRCCCIRCWCCIS